MKFSFSILATVLLFAPTWASAQAITILATDMPQAGDIVYRATDTLPLVSAGQGGPSQYWGMDNVIAAYVDSTVFMLPSATPYASSFASANIASTSDNIGYVYFNQSADSLTTIGLAGDLIGNGTVLQIPFSPTMLVQKFPNTYNSHFMDTYGLDVTTDGTAFGVSEVRLKRTSVIHDSTDGWGIITTPSGTYDAIRSKRIEYSIDSIWAKILPVLPFSFIQESRDTAISYNWLTKQTKVQVAELQLDSLGNPATFIWTVASSVGIHDKVQEVLNVQTFPAPASDKVTFQVAEGSTLGESILSIYNMEGKTVFSEKVDWVRFPSFSINTQMYPQGNYAWVIHDAKGKVYTHGKLILEK